MKKPIILEDDADLEAIAAYEKGSLKPARNQKQGLETARQAAHNYLNKQARINIRLSEADLRGLKLKAAEEGLPYQTLIASILHKFVSGRLKSKGT